MNLLKITFFWFVLFFSQTGWAQNIGADYTRAWRDFYPSRATSLGSHTYIFSFENYGDKNIKAWLNLNRKNLKKLQKTSSVYAKDFPVNTRLLCLQMRKEIFRWERQAPHHHELSLYTESLQSAWTSVLKADYLSIPEKASLLCQRLEVSDRLVEAAFENLEELDKTDAQNGLRSLAQLQTYLAKELPAQTAFFRWDSSCPDFNSALKTLIGKLKSLQTYVQLELLPKAKEGAPYLGLDEYTRQLALYTDNQLSPQELERAAWEEIQETRQLIQEVAQAYLNETYPREDIPEEDWVRRAFADMEKEVPKNGADYKNFWLDLAESAIAFIRDHQIATLPKFQTLRIENAPESAGPAARIGWVDSAAPFEANPITTLFLPSIPDTLPEQEQIDFWSSFNKPFNRMIVIHELFPGHYMQIKVSRETPHPLRLLFPYSPYFEGWATFTEKVLLDAGWEEERKLTYLAHLRKRLENANRAYTSVQVHCHEWTQEQVLQFSTETALLAPQFAKSLWGRIMRSPMQLTSYFWGGQQFKELLNREQERLGDQFELQRFMDTIMKAGPIPIDAFDALFQATTFD